MTKQNSKPKKRGFSRRQTGRHRKLVGRSRKNGSSEKNTCKKPTAKLKSKQKPRGRRLRD